jgi:hypothetical protein
MPSAIDSAIDISAAALNLERADALLKQNRFVAM